MAFRHYGGSAPKVEAEWTCPSCQTVQSGPLKAGCQACGAGNDAKRVAGLAPETHALIAEEKREDAQRVTKFTTETLARAAYEQWVTTHPWVGEIDPEQLQEAFMAGVAWMQSQWVQAQHPVATPVTSPVTGQEYLYLTEGQALTDTSVEPVTLQTLLAALAFYRDNVLGYGAVPGQLSADQVTDLISRLSPPVEEP